MALNGRHDGFRWPWMAYFRRGGSRMIWAVWRCYLPICSEPDYIPPIAIHWGLNCCSGHVADFHCGSALGSWQRKRKAHKIQTGSLQSIFWTFDIRMICFRIRWIQQPNSARGSSFNEGWFAILLPTGSATSRGVRVFWRLHFGQSLFRKAFAVLQAGMFTGHPLLQQSTTALHQAAYNIRANHPIFFYWMQALNYI